MALLRLHKLSYMHQHALYSHLWIFQRGTIETLVSSWHIDSLRPPPRVFFGREEDLASVDAQTHSVWIWSLREFFFIIFYFKIYYTCENLSSIGRRSCEITMKEEKHTCHTKLCAFRCLISRPHILNLRSRNQVHGKLLLSRKLHCLQREPFLTMFYTINSYPILVTKKGFMLIIILSNYQ